MDAMLIYPVIGIVSAAGLVLQISLTRVFAVGQWYHYAFLSVKIGRASCRERV